jgi:hypothetical protein
MKFLCITSSLCDVIFQSRGGGFEIEMYYPQWRRINKPIDRHQVLLDSLAKLIEGQFFIFIIIIIIIIIIIKLLKTGAYSHLA